MNDRPHYPWNQGDELFAEELNAAIANASGMGGFAGAVNVIDYGADPTGATDSAPAINAAASQVAPNGRRRAVYLPAGTYSVRSQITLSAGQAFFGDSESSSVIQVFDSFDPAATSVILCTGSTIDPGPTIRDLNIVLTQPNDVASRATFLTLASGGTSHNGGTGVQYPWAISTSGNSGRIQVRNVCIVGAWNGINADAACFWIQGLKISAFNIGIAIGGTLAAGVLDWAFYRNIEFWPFGLSASQKTILGDGQTVAMRIGSQNGLVGSDIAVFLQRVNFTADAAGGWFQFTNLSMDGTNATINVLACFFLLITNLYCTAATGALRATISTNGAAPAAVKTININTWFGYSGSTYPLLDMTGGGNINIVNAYLSANNIGASIFNVTAGTLRVTNCKIYPTLAGSYTVPLIVQNNTGSVQLSNLDISGNTSSSGIAIQSNVDSPGNILGFIRLDSGWTNFIAGRVNGQYGPWAPVISPGFTGSMTLTANSGAAVALVINAPTSQQRAIFGASAGLGRWSVFFGDSATESGSAAGSDFSVNRYNDAGTFLNAPLKITRRNGAITLADLQVSASYANDAAASAAGVAVGQLYRSGSAVMVRVT